MCPREGRKKQRGTDGGRDEERQIDGVGREMERARVREINRKDMREMDRK